MAAGEEEGEPTAGQAAGRVPPVLGNRGGLLPRFATGPATRGSERWPRVARPAEISDADFNSMKTALARHTYDEIRSIEIIQTSPLTVRIHTASPHIVTEGEYTLRKLGNGWKVGVESEIIH